MMFATPKDPSFNGTKNAEILSGLLEKESPKLGWKLRKKFSKATSIVSSILEAPNMDWTTKDYLIQLIYHNVEHNVSGMVFSNEQIRIRFLGHLRNAFAKARERKHSL